MHLLDNPARSASKSTALVECPGDKAPREQDQHRQFAAGQTMRRWGGRIVLALAVGLAYFVVAQVTDIGLVLQPASISVFWPAAGVSSFFQAEDGIRDSEVTGVQTCALPI